MKMNNPVLIKTTQAIEAKVPPKIKAEYDKCVVVGEKIVFSEQTRQLLDANLKSDPNPAVAAGTFAAKLFGIILTESKGKADMNALGLACSTLLCEILDFMEDIGQTRVTPQLLAEATKQYGNTVMQIMGITPEKMQQMMQQSQAKQGA